MNKTYNCSHCGQEINKRKRPERYKNIFCSNECKSDFYRNKSGKNCSCKNCGKEVYRLNKEIKKTKNVFCSHSCSASFNNKGSRKYGNREHYKQCCNCGKEKNSSVSKCCSRKCNVDYQYKNYIDKWLNGKETGVKGFGISIYIRRYLFELRGKKCEICGWNKEHPITKQPPVHIDHINGNWEDNRLENLRILCPNCHSLTETFGSHNTGNGRRISGKIG